MNDQQKRLLGIGAVGLVAFLFLKSRGGARTTTPVATTGQIAPYTPQAIATLQPGESVYDPNSQALLTTPSPVDTTGGVPGNGSQATAPAMPFYSVNVNYPAPTRITSHRKRPTKRVAKRKPLSKKKAA